MNPLDQATISFKSQNVPEFIPDNTIKVQGRWNYQEHLKFLNAIILYGKDWKKVEDEVTSRNGAQVRSHAQKYFLKITKIIKDRKKIKGKRMPEITETEVQLKEYFAQHPLGTNAPREVIELLKIQKVGIKSIIEENCDQGQKVSIQQLLAPTLKVEKKKLCKVTLSQPSLKVLQTIQNQVNQLHEDSSFLSMLIRRNKDYFSSGGSFSAFIDYGHIKKEKAAIQDQETSAIRKYSFTHFDGQNTEQ